MRTLTHTQRRNDGFTLIELLVVVLIIGILAAIAVPTFLGQRKKAQDRQAQASVAIALHAGKTTEINSDGRGFPTTFVADAQAVEPALTIVNQPSTGPKIVSAARVSDYDIVLAALSESGACFVAYHHIYEGTTYGSDDGACRADTIDAETITAKDWGSVVVAAAEEEEDSGTTTTSTRTLVVPAGMNSVDAYEEDWYFGCPPGMALVPGSGRYTVDPEPETHYDYYLEDIGAYGVYVDNSSGTEGVLIEASVDCEGVPESTDPIWVSSEIVVIPAGSATEELFAEGALTLTCPTGEFLWAQYSIHTGEPEYTNDSVWANTYSVWVENYEGSEPVELEAYGECG